MLSPDIPPWRRPAAASVRSGRGADMGTHLAKPEKSGGAKLRDWDDNLAKGRNRYVRRTALAKQGKPCDAKARGLLRISGWQPARRML